MGKTIYKNKWIKDMKIREKGHHQLKKELEKTGQQIRELERGKHEKSVSNNN